MKIERGNEKKKKEMKNDIKRNEKKEGNSFE